MDLIILAAGFAVLTAGAEALVRGAAITLSVLFARYRLGSGRAGSQS